MPVENGEEKDPESAPLEAETEDEPLSVATKRTFSFKLSENEFNDLVDKALSQVETGEISFFKFPYTLNSPQRKIIHKKAAKSGLKTKSEGKRYRIIYLYKNKYII